MPPRVAAPAQLPQALLRANPPKDGDAEPRGYGITALPAEPPADRSVTHSKDAP
jgi:hypothetical protein